MGQHSYASAERVRDPEEEMEKELRKKQRRLRSRMLDIYLKMYGGDNATIQHILGSDRFNPSSYGGPS